MSWVSSKKQLRLEEHQQSSGGNHEGSKCVCRTGRGVDSTRNRAGPRGGILRLEKGSWEESLVVDKSLTLCGAGRERTSIQAGSPKEEEQVLLYIRAPEGEEIRVILRDLSLNGSAGGGGLFAERGVRLTLERCVLSESLFGLMLAADAEARLDECLIRKNDSGVTLWEDSQITIRRCAFLENATGLDFAVRERVRIENCLFRGYELAIDGVAGQITIQDCIVEEGELAGIDLSFWTTEALIERCKVQRNQLYGISITDGAQVTIRECVVSNNRCGIDVKRCWSFSPGSRAVIERCVIARNEIGICVTESSQAAITDCRIRGSEKGLYLDRGGVEVTIEGNRIRRNRHGISAFRPSRFTTATLLAEAIRLRRMLRKTSPRS